MRRRFVLVVRVSLLPIGALASPHRAFADPFNDDDDIEWSRLPAVGSLAPVLIARLTNTYGGGSGAFSRAPRGFFAAADGGAGFFFASGQSHARAAVAFGGRAGYQWRNGLALQLGFDDLGVEPASGGGPLLLPSGGIRYSFPLLVEPFAEALVGGVFNQAQASPAGGLGVGLSVPVVRHLAFELTFRNWMVSLDGAVRDIPTLELGVAAGFVGG